MRFSASTEIDTTTAEAWATLESVEEWPQWVACLKKLERIPEGPIEVGTRIRISAKYVIMVSFVMTITEFVHPRCVVLEGKVLGCWMKRHYTLEPMSRKVVLTAGGDVSGPLSLLVRHAAQKLSEEIVQAHKKKIERSG